MSGRATLVEMAKHNLAYARTGNVPFEDDIYEVPASNYYAPERWRSEIDRIFKRLPLMLALTCEMKNPGDYKAMSAVDVPVLICRGSDGQARAFVNMCRHRGAMLMEEGSGNAKRFSCPYHAWSYDQQGDLVGVYAADDFGQMDKSNNG